MKTLAKIAFPLLTALLLVSVTPVPTSDTLIIRTPFEWLNDMQILRGLHPTVHKYDDRQVFRVHRKFSILFLGDILLANEAERYIREFGPDYPFLRVRDELRNYDAVFGNMETPISTKGEPVKDKPYTFQLAPGIVSALRTIKLDAVSIANNHVLDYGVEGLRDTIGFLREAKILYSGAGNNVVEARSPTVLYLGNREILIFSRCSRPPDSFYTQGDRPGIAMLKTDELIADIAEYKTKNNIVLLSLHWGIERTTAPQKSQIEIAHRLIDAGADGIIGHHPHWPQGIELYRKKPIIYSLGNFVSGYYNDTDKDNIVAVFHYDVTSLDRIEILSVAGINREINCQPYFITGKRARKNLAEIARLSRRLDTAITIGKDRGIIRP